MTLLKTQLSEGSERRRGKVGQDQIDQKNEQIARYLNAQVSEEEKKQIESVLQKQPEMLKAALFQATQQSAMQRALPELPEALPADQETTQEKTQKQRSSLVDIIQQGFRFKMPVWTTVPMTVALATFALFLLLPQVQGPGPGLQPTHYQDNQSIQFQAQAQPPGMGFFNQATKSSRPYGNIEARFVNEGQLVLSWPPVEKAQSYTMQLQIFEGGQKVTLGSVDTHVAQAKFSGLTQRAGVRYAWRLTGKTNDALVFLTSGGFVFDEK